MEPRETAQEAAQDRLSAILSQVCNGCCKWPLTVSGDVLDAYCDMCPLAAVIDLFGETGRIGSCEST